MSAHNRRTPPILLKEAEDLPEKRPFPVSALTGLLLFQAGCYMLISLQAFLAHPFAPGESPDELIEFLVVLWQTSLAFTSLAIVSLLAAAAFFRLWQQAWGLAMLVQGASLLTVLLAYFRQTSGATTIYLVMLLSIFMVSYLNHPEVLATFGVSLSLKSNERL